MVAGRKEASWSSCICRRGRGRKVAELLSEAVAEDGLLMFIAAGPGFGVQAALTFGFGEIISAKWLHDALTLKSSFETFLIIPRLKCVLKTVPNKLIV